MTTSTLFNIQPRSLQEQHIENKALQEQLAHIDYLFHATRDAIAVLDSNLFLRRMNSSFKDLFYKIFGIEIQLDMNLSASLESFSSEKNNLVLACKQALDTQQCIAVINENGQLHQNNYYCSEILISPTYDAKYEHELILGIRDLTTVKLLEHERYKQQVNLAHAYKDSVKRELTSAIAHELNQPLTAIMAYARACVMKWHALSQQSDLSHILEQILLQAEHADKLIQSVRKIVKKEDLYYEPFDLELLIEECILILGYILEDYIVNIKINSPSNLMIIADRTQILQVLLNLCRNRIEAFKFSFKANPKLMISVEMEDKMVVVHIKDNGPGIPEDLQNLLFNSYCSSKPQGMGIGLVICFSIIQQHHGSIQLHASSKEGTWFTFSLPIDGHRACTF